MFLADRLVYLELQKTGCTHIVHLLSECIEGESIGKHNRLDRPAGDRLVVGSVRDPWSWYVSLWAYGCSKRGTLYHCLIAREGLSPLARRAVREVRRQRGLPRRTLRRALAELRKPIDEWRAVYADASDAAGFRRWVGMLFDPVRQVDLREQLHESSLATFAGLLTHRYLRLYSREPRRLRRDGPVRDWDALRAFDRETNITGEMIRNEALEADVLRVLDAAGYRLTDEQVAFIQRSADDKRNTSRHKPAIEYYDEATLDLVTSRERFIVEKHGYAVPALPGATPAPAPVPG